MKASSLALAATMAAIVGGSAVTARSATPPAAQQFTVTMANMSYGRLPGGVKVGDTIIWVNRDTVPHTATARDRSFDVRVTTGQSVRMKVAKAGTFAIYCIFHPTMRGTLTVAP